MAIYLKYGDVKGHTTTDGFKDWIECTSFHWGSPGTLAVRRVTPTAASTASRHCKR